jgi:probable HAF family extracellular repeat protein
MCGIIETISASKADARALVSHAVLGLFLLAGAGPALAASASYTALPGFPDAISADATTVVGVVDFGNGSHAFRLNTSNNMLTDLGTFGGTSSEAYAVNTDGSVIVGYALNGVGLSRAFRWTTAGLIDMGTLGGSTAAANGVNADGSVVVGEAATSQAVNHAFRWTTAGMADLGTLGGSTSSAQAVNADGSVVVGYAGTSGNAAMHAFRWTTAGMNDLGTLGGSFSTAVGVNNDGSVVVGYADTNVAQHAFRWTTAGMVDLGSLGGTNANSVAYAVNGNGTVVVGASYTTTGFLAANQRGFRWEAGTMMSVDNWLRAQGVTLSSDVTATAQGVSADGNVIVGQSQNGNGYIARGATTVTSPGNPNSKQTVSAGIMNPATYQATLAGAGTARLNAAVQGADMTINGDNSSPMYNLLQVGQSSVWTSGDLGRVYTKAFSGTVAVGELGVAYSPVQGFVTRFSGGRTYTKSTLTQGGDSRIQGGYVLPEATLLLGHQIYGTITGYANWGDVATRRGYSNGDGINISSSASGVQTYGFRARLDWLNAYRIAATNLSPYASFTRTSTYVGSFTEMGGAFPAFFNGDTQNADIGRLGSDAEYQLTPWLSLIGRAEYAHRFEQSEYATTGTILGLSDFNLAGTAIRQNWVRGAIGARAAFGPGEGFLLFNASNQTAGSTYWLNANYRVVF